MRLTMRGKDVATPKVRWKGFHHMRSLSVAAIFALSLVGCSSTPQSALKLISQDSMALNSQAFTPGVADVREAGDTDVVMSCRTESTSPDAPAVQQVLHVHV